MAKRSGLGKGLGALFADMEDDGEEIADKITKEEKLNRTEKQIKQDALDTDNKTDNIASDKKKKSDRINEINLEVDTESVYPNVNQPRKRFNEETMIELADSIKVHGIIQPLIVVKREHGYMIIAGERRWRAASMAGLKKVPVIIKDYSEQKIKEVSLIENLQREDLNVIDAAYAIKQLMEEFKFTQEEVAERLGKSRSAIANTIRLLSLNIEVIKLLENDRLTSGHARCLVVVTNADDQIALANAASDNKLTVRDLEKLVREYLDPTQKLATKKAEQSPELKELVIQLTRSLGTKVSVLGNDRKGRISIDYFTRDDLERIAGVLTGIKA